MTKPRKLALLADETRGLSRRQALAATAGAVGTAGLTSGCVTASAQASALPNDDASLARFTLNIETWWRPAPLADRIEAAARAGFRTVEMWNLGTDERDPATLKRRSRDAGLNIIHCTVTVPAIASATPAEMRDAVSASLDQIGVLGARYGTVVGHEVVDGMNQADMLAAYRDRMAEVAPLFEAAGVIACIEPFNPCINCGRGSINARSSRSRIPPIGMNRAPAK